MKKHTNQRLVERPIVGIDPEDQRFLPVPLRKDPDSAFPDDISQESREDAIKLLDILDIGYGFEVANVLKFYTEVENTVAMGLWVQQQRKFMPYKHIDELVQRLMDAYTLHNMARKAERPFSEH